MKNILLADEITECSFLQTMTFRYFISLFFVPILFYSQNATEVTTNNIYKTYSYADIQSGESLTLKKDQSYSYFKWSCGSTLNDSGTWKSKDSTIILQSIRTWSEYPQQLTKKEKKHLTTKKKHVITQMEHELKFKNDTFYVREKGFYVYQKNLILIFPEN